MLYFGIILYLIILIYFFDYKGKVAQKNVHRQILLIIFVLLSGLRYRMAPDTVAYMDNFKYLMVPFSELTIKNFTESRYQPLWILINSASKSLGSYVFLQIISAMILNICVFYFFKKTTTKVFTCILFYFLVDYFYFNMEIVRESLAIGVFLIAMINYNERKFFKCFFLIMIAFLFHHFAAVLFLVPFFLTNYISYKIKLGFSTVLIVFLFYFESPLVFIDSYLAKFSTVDVTLYDLADFNMSIYGYLYMVLKIVPVLLIIIIYRKKDIPNIYFKKSILFSLSLLYVIIVIIRATTIPFIERFSNYFIIFVILLITGALYDLVNRYVIRVFQFQSILLASIVCFLFQIFPLLEINPIFGVPLYKRYYPYYSVLSEKTDPDRELMTEMEGKE